MRKKIYIIAAAVVLLLAFVIMESSHDLSGAYYTSEFFLVSDITFFRDGTFTASTDYEILEGRYSKRVIGDTYSLRFTNGKSNSGNPISNFRASEKANKFELKAEKIDDGYLRVYVIPGADYLAWLGKSADFYQYGTVEDAINEAMNWETNETSALYEAEQAYTDEQLCDMARTYYIEHYNYNPAFVQIDRVEGDIVTIHLFDIVDNHTATCDWYYIDRYTAKGTNFAGEEIELML